MNRSVDVTNLLLNTFATKMATSAASKGDSISSDSRWSYREAAAVLLAFRPQHLNPVNDQFRVENPYLALYGDMVHAPGGRERMLMSLKPEIRREALLRLGSRERLLAALAANPSHEESDGQVLFESWMRGSQPPIEDQNYMQLTLSAQVVEWLRGVVPDLPPLEELRRHIDRKSVVSSFEHLASKGFVGRQRELQVLSDYVGVLPSASGLATAVRLARQWLGLQQRPPLVLWGPGGVGKSALLGRFLLDHANLDPQLRFPFAYLPFDNPALRVSDPFTLIVESVNQFQAQFPEYKNHYEDLRRFVERYRDERARLGDRGSEVSTVISRLDMADKLNLELYQRFGALTHLISHRGDRQAPTLLVFDTFEEVQYHDREKLIGLWRMLSAMQNVNPLLRTVISGRARVEDIDLNGAGISEMPLEELEMENRLLLLEKLGIRDRAAARSVAQQVGGNPLTLRLAARVMQSESVGRDGIVGLTTRKFLFFSVSEELIRGQLYLRVLDHIHDPDVRKLAHPGMVLRRVTPDIIRDVLAEVCGVEAKASGRKESLFDQLKREHALVRIAADGSLHYRPEIRKAMLMLLKQDRPAETRAIHERAVLFYRTQPADTPVNRAEEIYHCLMLDEDPQLIEHRWIPGAGDLLLESIEELPPPAVAWLASQMGIHVDEHTAAQANLQSWERHTGRRVRELIRYSQFEEAQKRLSARTERSVASPLYTLEARVLFALGDLKAAVECLDRGTRTALSGANRGRLAEMLWLKAVILEQGLNDIKGADETLEEALDVARRTASSLSRVQICTQRLALRQSHKLPGSESIRAALAEAVSQLDESGMANERGVVRKAIGFLASEYPLTFMRALRVVELTTDRTQVPRALEILARYVEGPPPWKDEPEVLWWKLQGYIDIISPPDREPDPRLINDLAELIRSDSGTLTAVTLAGIDEYRESWELESPPEASA